MRVLKYLLFATTLLYSFGIICHGRSLANPIDDQYIKYRVDSTFTSDSIQRLQNIEINLRKADEFLNASQLDSALSYAKAVIKFDVNVIPGESLAHAYYIIGKVNRLNHRMDIALKNFLIAIQKLRYSNEIGYRSEICQELAIIYYENGWISKSIEKYIDAYNVEILKFADAPSGKGKERIEKKQIELLQAISSIYLESNDYKNAIIYQERLLPIYLRHNIHNAIKLMGEISDNYLVIKNHQAAIVMQTQILNYRKKTNDLEGYLEAELEIMKIYKDQPDYQRLGMYFDDFNNLYDQQKKEGLTPQLKKLKAESLLIFGDLNAFWGSLEVPDNYRRALMYYDSAQYLYASIAEKNKVAETKLLQADVYFELQDYRSVIDLCELVLPVFQEESNYVKLTETYKLIAESYMHLDRYKLAYQAQNQFLLYSDSLEKIQIRQMDQLISQYKENANRIAFQNLEQGFLQEELDTLSDELLHLEIEKQKRDIELLVKEKSLKDLALKNEQLKNEQVTNENILLQQKIEADIRDKQILNLQAVRSRQEAELKNQQIYQITKEQQIYALEQEKKLSKLQLQKANAQKVVFLLSIIISLIILISVIIGYFNLRQSRSKIAAKNKFIEEQNVKLKDLNEEKNRLIRIVAHDLKNPLTNAITLSDILHKNNNLNINAEQQNISLIRRSLKRMHEMINKILDIKAIDSEKLNLEIEAINIKQVLNYLIESFSRKARKKEIEIVSDIEELYVNADRDYFTQILENLISNALKFSPKNTIVRIKSNETHDTCQISVTDQGPGFTAKEKKQLFTEFQKFSSKPTLGESSNGIGLSIVKKYVDIMGGKVWCDSQKGVGTTFHVEFEKALILV
jgi:signal transduction histidine kinase